MGMFGDLSKAAKAEFGALVAARYDSWQNLITGLGTTRDKRTGATFQPDAFLDPQSLENLFNGDDMAAKAAGLIVSDALKTGYDLTSGKANDAGDAKDEADEVKQYMDNLDVEAKVSEAATWGRLYGAGGILLGVNDGKKPTAELIDDDVTSLDFLTTLDIRDLFVVQYYSDPLKSNYGQPMIYRVQPVTGTQSMIETMENYVHASRVIIFDGVLTSRRTRIARQGWSLSVLQRLYEVLRDANANWSSTSHLMTDANLAVIKIKGFLQMIAAKDTADFETRMQMLDMAKSVARAYVCDAELEDYERKATSFAGYPELLDRTWQRLAAAMPEPMPVTKLIGISPAGMNATGDSDERMWGTSVESYRRKTLKKPIERIARLCAQTIGVSEPDSIAVSFQPFRQLSPSEEAERRLKVANADHIYITDGVWLPEEVAAARVKDGEYSADPPIIDLELRQRVLDKTLASYEANAGKTPAELAGNPDGTQGGQANQTTTGGGDVPDDGTSLATDAVDDEARDKDGKWTVGGASGKSPKGGSDRASDIARQSTPAMDAPHFHGTDAKNIPSILAHGIKPTRDIVKSAVKNGGFTVDLAGKAAPSDGFSVSPYPEHERKIVGNITAKDLKSYRDDKADFVKADPTRKLGGWYNVKDDTWYLDVSHVVQDRGEAMKIAREHKQLAIYNFKTGKPEDTEK